MYGQNHIKTIQDSSIRTGNTVILRNYAGRQDNVY